MTDKGNREASAPPASVLFPVLSSETSKKKQDFVTIEEPLEIRIASRDGSIIDQSISITMRTPGNDFELASGFLFGEGIVRNPSDITDIEFTGEESIDKGIHNVVRVVLREGISFDPDTLTRHFYTTSSCGVCGKSSLKAIEMHLPKHKPSRAKVLHSTLCNLPSALRNRQKEFNKTGGLHAAATFTKSGLIERIREDVGRHNAVDKLIGSYMYSGINDLTLLGLLLSGRSSFELVQKSVMAGISLIASIGPPTSLAIELAESRGITLIGFIKNESYNLYTGDAVI